MKELFSLLLLIAESKSSVVNAPEVLDTAALERWLTGSVWGLLGLNLFALTLFVLSISSPQVAKIKTLIQSWKAERARLKAEALAAKEAAAKEAAAQAEAVKIAATSSAPAPEQAASTTPQPIASASPPEPPPPPPAEATTQPTEATATEVLQEVTEELPKSAEEVSSQEQSPPAPAMEIPPPPQPLPESDVSGEKKEAGDKMTFESKQDFEKALNEFLSSPSEQTEEIPIFDTKALDESLQWKPEAATKDRTKEDPS